MNIKDLDFDDESFDLPPEKEQPEESITRAKVSMANVIHRLAPNSDLDMHARG